MTMFIVDNKVSGWGDFISVNVSLAAKMIPVADYVPMVVMSRFRMKAVVLNPALFCGMKVKDDPTLIFILMHVNVNIRVDVRKDEIYRQKDNDRHTI